MDMTPTEVRNATQDLSGLLNRLTDVALSGTPRVCISQSYYFKVFSDCEPTDTPTFEPSLWKTYDNADLSGTPKLLVFEHDNDLYWVKGYPTASETLNPTADIIQNLVTAVPDDAVAGDPKIFRMLSGGNSYYERAGFDEIPSEEEIPLPAGPPPLLSTIQMEAGVAAVRALLSAEPAAILYRDAEIDSWLNQAAIDVSGKSLYCQEIKTLYAPVQDLSGSLSRFMDVTLSGTPRVCISQGHYFKVFPTRAGTETSIVAPQAWETCDDTALSGTPKRLGFAYAGELYWVKGYPTAEATSNPTDDPVQNLVFAVPDDSVAGTPVVFEILSGGNYHYFKAYKLTGYAVCDTLLTLPLPAGTLKLFSVLRTNDGGYPQGMMRIHPRMMGHLPDAASGDSHFFYEFAQELGLAPGGGSLGITLNLHRAYLVDAFVDLPDDLQSLAIIYAYVLALYKALKFETAAMAYQTYLQTLFQIRRGIYGMDSDDKANFMLADRKELVR
jgi:hypothetical protein